MVFRFIRHGQPFNSIIQQGIANLLFHYARHLAAVYFVGLAVVTVIPIGGLSTSLSDTTVVTLRLDYLLHALAFLPLVPLWKLARPKSSLWMVVFAGVCLAFAAEGLHYWIPYRGFNLNDMFGNTLGALLGVPLWLVLSRIMHDKENINQKSTQ